MSGEIGAAGDILTGAMLARAAEPDTGSTHAREANTCLNCHTTLIGAHCHNCGQSAHIHRTLSSFGHDILHSLAHFEGKIWRTLPMLVFRPGQLTRRYVHGERARFVSPLAMFLFAIFLMFSVFSWVGGPNISTTTVNGKVTTAELIKVEIAKSRAQLASLEAERSAKGNKTDASLDGKIDDLKDEINGMMTGLAVKEGLTSDAIKKADIHVNTGVASWDKTLAAQVLKARENPELIFAKMEQGAHKYAWIIIPLSLPFLWLTFFWRRDIKLYDHIVFITYSVCFMIFLVVTVAALSRSSLLKPVVGALIVFVPPLHIFFQLKDAYALRKRSAFWRTLVMIWAASVVLSLYAGIIILMGLIG